MNNVLFTKAIFYRNLKDYKFVPKLTNEKKSEIVESISKVLNNFKLINQTKADEKTINYLKENYLFNPNVTNLLIDETKGVCINLFNGEHLEILCVDQCAGAEAYKKIKDVADLLLNKISLAYADDYGYLMSDLTKIGSGLKLESEICLSCIKELGKIEQVKQNLKKLGYNLTETNYNKIYKLSTMCNLGIAEKSVFEDYEKMLKKLQDIEIESAKMLDVGNHDEIMDKSHRSLAILNNAYLLTNEELNSLLINIRTGLNLGNIEIDIQKINKLQKLSRDKNKEFISQSELKNLAQTVKEILKGE